MKYLIIYLLTFLLFSCKKEHRILGVETARQELKEALSDTSSPQNLFVKTLIHDERSAVATVEPLLFKTYGKDEIINEKPYEVYLIDGYWVLSGTMPDDIYGGTFLIVFSAKDGRVIELTHGK